VVVLVCASINGGSGSSSWKSVVYLFEGFGHWTRQRLLSLHVVVVVAVGHFHAILLLPLLPGITFVPLVAKRDDDDDDDDDVQSYLAANLELEYYSSTSSGSGSRRSFDENARRGVAFSLSFQYVVIWNNIIRTAACISGGIGVPYRTVPTQTMFLHTIEEQGTTLLGRQRHQRRHRQGPTYHTNTNYIVFTQSDSAHHTPRDPSSCVCLSLAPKKERKRPLLLTRMDGSIDRYTSIEMDGWMGLYRTAPSRVCIRVCRLGPLLAKNGMDG
jgi:hypothetical protein